MAQRSPTTLELLQRWHAGDRRALEELLALHVPWMRNYVRRRMGLELRAFQTSEDVVQDALASFLQHGPAFLPENEAQFRGLIAKVVLNRLRDLHDHAHAAKRDLAREHSLASSGVSRIGAFARSTERPERVAEESELQGFLRLALQLIEPGDRELIELREWERLEFAEIGRRLGIQPDAARMRFNHALARLRKQVQALQTGRLDDLCAEVSGV